MIVWRRVCIWFYVRGFDPEHYRIAGTIDRKRVSPATSLVRAMKSRPVRRRYYGGASPGSGLFDIILTLISLQ